MQRSRLERAVARRMDPVARGWRQLADQALVELRVSNSAGWCLIHLDRLGGEARQTDLAQAIGITQPSLVRTVDQLESAGLVARLQDPNDRRSNLLTFTPEGQGIVGQIEAKLHPLREELLEGVPDADIETMLRLLDILGARIAERRG